MIPNVDPNEEKPDLLKHVLDRHVDSTEPFNPLQYAFRIGKAEYERKDRHSEELAGYALRAEAAVALVYGGDPSLYDLKASTTKHQLPSSANLQPLAGF
jgi:precorrin-2 methylase